jgi:hypothetical protein
MSVLMREEMTVLRRAAWVTDDGRPTRIDPYTDAYVDVYGGGETPTRVMGAFRQRLAGDTVDGGLLATDEVEVYLAGDPKVDVGDGMIVRGETYEVVSTGYPQVNFRLGTIHHRVVRIRRRKR